jgi:ribosome recycling factor
MIDEVLLDADRRMQKSIEAIRREFSNIRSGRATPALVDHIKVDAYGVLTPLNQVATISIPEASLLIIQPWDKNVLANIQKAIQKSDLGINPINDGNIIRLVVPSPTEERRRELVKVVRKRVEEAKIGIRNLRREAMEELRKLQKGKEISQDESERALDRLQKITDGFIREAEQIGQDKEAEILEI